MESDNNKSESILKDSLESHGKVSYYHSDMKLPKESQELLKEKELIAGGDIPKYLGKTEPQKISKNIEIDRYDFMNDGVYAKAIIDLKKNYPELLGITESDLIFECTYNTLRLTVQKKDSLDKYVFFIKQTRENIIAEKSKCYIRKDKIYVAAHKEKEVDWWSLRAAGAN